MPHKVKIWDCAVRSYHWGQLLLVAGLWYTGEQGFMAVHQLLAYSLLALLLARVVWGFIGSSNARFRQFAATPSAAMHYLRHPVAVPGHNPASFYMIMLLLLLLVIQLLTGLASIDNSYISDGPLVAYLPASWVDVASAVHKANINVLLAAIAAHIVAAIWHSWRHDNVISTMLTGYSKQVKTAAPPSLKNSSSFFLFFAVFLVLLYFWQGQSLLALL